MDLDDDAIERIGAAIQSLQQSGRGDGPLRLYRTRGGEFVRVLDDDTAPLTPETLRAIEAYMLGESAPVEMEDVGADDDAANGTSPNGETSHVAPRSPVAEENGHDLPLPSSGTHEDTTLCEEADAGNGDVVMEDVSDVPKPAPPLTVEEATPISLATAGIPVIAWLNGANGDSHDLSTSPKVEKCIDSTPQAQTTSEISLPSGDPIEMLMCRWPREITERTRLCYGATREYSLPPKCIVYWLRNTLRVSHGNFGLAAALELAKHHKLPVVALYLSPSSIMYPLRHASGINDALSRWSVTEVRRRLRDDHGIEMFGFTPQDAWNPSAVSSAAGIDGGNALHMLLDSFQPAAVVTDDGFSKSARGEVDCLRQFLQTRVRAPWPLLAVDSMTCLPLQSLSEVVRKSLSVETAPYVSEDEFFSEYATLLQHRELLSTPADPSVPSPSFQTSVRVAVRDALNAAMTKIQLQEITWSIVDAMNTQSANAIAAGSERIGLERLHLLVTATDERPAIQQELQGSGIMSLVPFIRHGAIFSGYVLDKLAGAISSIPRPTDAKSRKAFAMLKVLRSRALSHLAKERDYGLYLSLWATRQVERDVQLSGRATPFRALSSFKTDLSELDTYKHALPAWISPNKHLGNLSRQSPVYDPYQLESGRTDDQYWNEIQMFLIEKRYVHPLVVMYWAYKILQWSISTRAGIATIDALLDKCSLGSTHSPDAIFSVWATLFRIGKTHPPALDSDEAAFVSRLEAELSSQPRLQFRK